MDIVTILEQLYFLILEAIGVYRIILFAYFLMSWLPGAYESALGQIMIRICEPYVGFFRRFVPPIGMISIAGIVSLVALEPIRLGIGVLFQLLINLFQ